MLHAARTVTGAILWANLRLLFWPSLFPFATAWMVENHFAPEPSAAHGVVLLCAAIAYWILQQAMLASEGADSVLARAVGRDWKGRLSPLLYLVAAPSALVSRWLAQAIFVVVALIWLVSDRRIERLLRGAD